MNTIPIHLSNSIRIRKQDLPADLVAEFQKRLTWPNPLFGRKLRFGVPVPENTPANITAWHDDGDDILIAKGYLSELVRILHTRRLTPSLQDARPTLHATLSRGITFEAAGLSGDQAQAIALMQKNFYGTLEGLPGTGKKVCALKLAMRLQVPVLIIVQTRAELYQWRELCLDPMHGLQPEAVGLIGDTHFTADRYVTIAVAMSLWKHISAISKEVGLLVVDRANTAPLSTIFKTRHFNCKHQWGLATGPRQDGLTRLMEAFIGPRIVRLSHAVDLPSLQVVPTAFEGPDDFKSAMELLTVDQARNQLIAADILQAAASDRRCVVVSDRISHLNQIAAQVDLAMGPEFVILHSGVSDLTAASHLARFNVGKLRILAVPMKSVPLLDPVRTLDCFFVVAPVKQADYLMQIITKMKPTGRICEYKDRSRMLRKSLGRRVRVYRRMGIQ